MPKRMLPHEFDFYHEKKKRNTEVEVTAVQCNEKSVYARTVELLFQGARSCPMVPTEMDTTQAPCRDAKSYKQLLLDNNCCLQDNRMLENKLENGAENALQEKCRCDEQICPATSKTCSHCGFNSCENCSSRGIFNNYEDQYICLDCYRGSCSQTFT